MKLRIHVAAALIAAAFSAPAFAGSGNTNLDVSATVAGSCGITTTALAFGSYDPVTANAATALTGTGAVNVTCTKGSTGVSVTLGQGVNGARNMKASTSADLLDYEIYQPATATPYACSFPGTQVWGDTGAAIYTPTVAAWDASTPQSFSVCGTIAAGQNVSADTYSDTVVATVNF
jgi:spore coat protein U-like protein